jgi:hypothetical protein
MRRSLVALAGVMAIGSAAAIAAPSDPFIFKGSFDGTGTLAKSFDAGSLAVNYATGNVLVQDRAHKRILQFDSTGKPVNFSGLGTPILPVAANGDITIDNSGGATQGNIYLSRSGGASGSGAGLLYGFGPDGSSLGGVFPLEVGFNFGSPLDKTCGATVTSEGNIWVSNFINEFNLYKLFAFTPGGTVVAEISMEPENSTGCGGAFDGLGYFYGGSRKFKPDSEFSAAFLGETGDVGGPSQIAVDPSTDDFFIDHGSYIAGFRTSDPLVSSSPFETLKGLDSADLAFDATGQILYVANEGGVDILHREPPSLPSTVGQVRFSKVRATSALGEGKVLPNGLPVTYQVEYGTDASYGIVTPVPAASLPASGLPTRFAAPLEGLKPNTTYHVRVAATSSLGTVHGPDSQFTTQPTPTGADPCPNALARKQTGAAQLPDCRAYELVSAADTGGYDVESSLVPGQTPFAAYPQAADRVLYATHSGAVPGPWKATNKGPDPYLATRGENSWSTDYVGLPSDINPLSGGFSSVLGGADASLSAFAFAGPGLCSPCFSSGLETGIPLRLPSGELAQGMSGSLNPGVPSAKPEGKVAKYLSADGSHLIFASRYAFEPGANDNGSDLTVYDRDLKTGTTRIASTTPGGATLTGADISELDISNDGSRIVVGQKVASDSAGNEYVHPYLHLGTSPNSVDLAPGTTSGVLYAGMTSDGSRLFFTTPDKLLGADTDTSADLYAAAVDGSGSLSLSLITTSDSDACTPVANSAGPHWNSTGAVPDCDAVAIGGGGGVASGSGAIYLLSPEQLDGSKGTADQPNLYVAEPGGSPRLIATLDPEDSIVADSVGAAATRESADFNVTPSGSFAAFPSTLPLTGPETNGNGQVFRYGTGSNRVDCASCLPTAWRPSGSGDAVMAPDGLSLTDDGRVFFTTPVAHVLADTNARKDVYEWVDDRPRLISSGLSTFDSALLSVSADGTDVYFFTRDALAPEEDDNGNHTRIYDARVNGGFFKLPPPVACAASDECHGPGTVAPGAPDIRSSGRTTTGNVVICAKNRVKRRGKCVKRQTHMKKHAKKAHAKKRAAGTDGKRGGRHA